VPLDLSKVLFIATANQLGTIHPALLDRMELIQLAGYSEEEKMHIARKYLLPRQMTEHGLPDSTMTLPDETLRLLISESTRGAGVLTHENNRGPLARKVAARIATHPVDSPPLAATVIEPADLERYLGPA